MRLKVVIIVVMLLASATIGRAHGEIVRCSGTALGTKADPFDFEVTLQIVLPDPREYDKSLTMVQGRDGRFVAIVGTSVGSYGLGLLEEVTTISSQTTKAKQTSKSVRYQLVVTGRPNEAFSLTGFYIKDGRPMLLRADLWHESRRFSLASTTEGLGIRLYSGRCE